MRQNPIGVICHNENDILLILKSCGLNVTEIKPGQISKDKLDACESIAILGGSVNKPLLLTVRERLLVEEQIKKGKKVYHRIKLV
jgi:hypothetical protein